jgi:hypothetical protein
MYMRVNSRCAHRQRPPLGLFYSEVVASSLISQRRSIVCDGAPCEMDVGLHPYYGGSVAQRCSRSCEHVSSL